MQFELSVLVLAAKSVLNTLAFFYGKLLVSPLGNTAIALISRL